MVIKQGIYKCQGGRTHVTKTYISSHCAPELLKDKKSLTLPRNIHHLEFGAAVVVFNLLMCGLHPYSYYDPARGTGCGNPEENLINGRCPLGTGAGCKFPVGNWYNLWSWLPHNIKSGFITTFRSERGHGNPEQRTSLPEWGHSLSEMIFYMNKYPLRAELFPVSPNLAAMKSKTPKESQENFFMNF